MIQILTDFTMACDKAKTMPWAYIASYGSLTMGLTPEKILFDEILDARFFGPEGELRLFRRGDVLEALWVDDTPCPRQLDTTIDKIIKLKSFYGKELTMRQHIVFDEDGQACIYTTRLAALKGGGRYDPGDDSDTL